MVTYDTEKSILVVFTGGTIGSIATEGTINTSDTAGFKLIQLFRQQYRNHQHVNFTSIQPLQMLSENVTPSAWTILIKAIEAAEPNQYHGIIVTHGTDTLSFTAAALSLYFNQLKVPLLLVSSNCPLEHANANGLNNFICAVEFIVQRHEPGVFIPYRNQNQSTHIHRGTRLAASLQLSGDFISVQHKHYLECIDNRFFIVNSEPPAPLIPRSLKPIFSDNILLIKPYPGLNYRQFCLNNTTAVLHDLYHSGTACISSQWSNDFSCLDFIKQCAKQAIPVYMAPAIKTEDTYQSTRYLLDYGAKMLWNMSLEVAYVKLALAYGNFIRAQHIDDFLVDDIALEHIP